jgi:hypothetical protein
MLIYNFKIIIELSSPVPNPHPSQEEWFTLLANIYGTKTKSFDGYVSAVEYSDTQLKMSCYLIEDIDSNEKLEPLKARYSDWNGYQKVSIMDSLKTHLRLLGYNAISIGIVSA